MRTEKELWEVVLNHQEYFKTGLCLWVFDLLQYDLLSEREYFFLKNALGKENVLGGYWIGTSGKIKPRIDWINNRIKELS